MSEAAVVALRRGALLRATPGAVLVPVLGVAMLVAACTVSGTGARIALLGFGVLDLLLAAAILAGLWLTNRVRAVVFDADGVRWESSDGAWQVGWAELRRLDVHVGYHRARGGRSYRVSLRLLPLDAAAFAARHEDLAHLTGHFVGGADGADPVYAVPLGPRRDLLGPVDAGARAHGGPHYGGIVDDGRPGGPGYATP